MDAGIHHGGHDVVLLVVASAEDKIHSGASLDCISVFC